MRWRRGRPGPRLLVTRPPSCQIGRIDSAALIVTTHEWLLRAGRAHHCEHEKVGSTWGLGAKDNGRMDSAEQPNREHKLKSL